MPSIFFVCPTFRVWTHFAVATCMRIHIHRQTHTQPVRTHFAMATCMRTHIHRQTGLCPLFSSSEGDGHRLYKPVSHTRHHTQACVLCSDVKWPDTIENTEQYSSCILRHQFTQSIHAGSVVVFLFDNISIITVRILCFRVFARSHFPNQPQNVVFS